MSRKLTRRELLRYAGMVGATAVLSGCQPKVVEVEKVVKETVVTTEEVEKIVKETVVAEPKFEGTLLRVMQWWDEASMQPVLDGFRDRYPGIELKMEAAPGTYYHDKLYTMLAAGTAADVSIMSATYAPKFWLNKVGLPLDDFLTRDGIDRAKFAIDPSIDGGADGVTYAISQWYPDAANIWVNVELFGEAGIPVPSYGTDLFLTWTWDDYLEAAKAMTKRTADGRAEQWGLNYFQGGCWSPHRHFVWSNGGEFTDDPGALRPTKTKVTEDPFVEAYQFMVDLYHVHQVTMSPSEAELFSEGAYLSGKVAMTHGWNSYGEMAKAEFEWTVIPDPFSKKITNHYGANHWCINRESEVADAAWEWTKFCAIDLQGRLAMTTFGPISSYDPEAQFPYAKTDAQRTLWHSVVERGNAAKENDGWRAYWLAGDVNDQFNKALSDAMDNMILSKAPVREELQKVADRIDPLLSA